ncbi:MAG: recombinase RecT [Oscillospiraceae bacterium]|jgi:recombination protein RecT|nr:recombinase RecT [Oscillospiraceae bacterium]
MANTKQTEQTTEITNAEPQNQLAMSEKFTNKVLKEFGGNVSGAMQVTEYQRTLIQGYFIAIDRALKAAEDERNRKNASNNDHKWDNELPINWNTVNLNDLALDLVHYARMGLDMMQDNMLFPIPYKNNKRNWYDVNLMEGYNGIRYIAEKYAVEVPTAVTIEVVYSTDKFHPIKKGKENRVENYEFEITNAFDRGTIVGGFAYLEFSDPTRNELIIMSMRDIEKRKPLYASANFWGGKKKEKVDGKWQEVEVDGWLDEMVRKTIIREAYSAKHLPRDPKKIDDAYQYMKIKEARYAELEAQAEIEMHANTILLGSEQTQPTLPSPAVIDEETGEVIDQLSAEAATAEQPNPGSPTF